MMAFPAITADSDSSAAFSNLPGWKTFKLNIVMKTMTPSKITVPVGQYTS